MPIVDSVPVKRSVELLSPVAGPFPEHFISNLIDLTNSSSYQCYEQASGEVLEDEGFDRNRWLPSRQEALARFEEAAATLGPDLERYSLTLQAAFEPVPSSSDEPTQSWMVEIRFNGQLEGIEGFSLSEPGSLLVDFASLVQEFVFEYKSWPDCPRHKLPLGTILRNNQPVWSCSRGSDLWFPIGRLPNPIPDHGDITAAD